MRCSEVKANRGINMETQQQHAPVNQAINIEQILTGNSKSKVNAKQNRNNSKITTVNSNEQVKFETVVAKEIDRVKHQSRGMQVSNYTKVTKSNKSPTFNKIE